MRHDSKTLSNLIRASEGLEDLRDQVIYLMAATVAVALKSEDSSRTTFMIDSTLFNYWGSFGIWLPTSCDIKGTLLYPIQLTTLVLRFLQTTIPFRWPGRMMDFN